MLTRLGFYADRVIEGGWLLAAVFAPLFFNVYSSRVFEPDKITTVRSIVLIMLVAWLVKLGERGWGAASQPSIAPTRSGRLSAAANAVVETAGPSWLGFLRVPVVIAILVYALVYLISTLFTVTPDASILGSYQRLQGTFSQYSYMLLGIIVLANMRTRAQVDRLINFMLMTSLAVALYGVIQAFKLDPLPWAGDTSTRVASSMGNAIFVAAWLIMVVPFTLYRLLTGFMGVMSARRSAAVETVEVEQSRSRVTSRRTRPTELPGYGWAVIANGAGIIISSLLVFYLALRMMAGLPYPDARTWWVLPVALIYFYAGILSLEWLGRHGDDPRQTGVFLPVVGVLVFFTGFLALTLTWTLSNNQTNGDIIFKMGFDGAGLLWALFFFLFWCSLSAAAYVLSAREREEGYANKDRGITRSALNVAYGFLLVVQVICIYLTQSRGPWLGLGAGLTAFMVATWLIGRSRNIRWMARLGGAVTAFVVVIGIFVALLNIEGSPLQALDNLPIVGRGIERLSTLTRTEDGTGKVRQLIWKGATDLILSDPGRALIGWGPESMYVAYNRFYPPELAQVELRNATPDRSHNVEFDQMVTLGVVGLLAYYFLVGTFFFFTLRVLKRATNTRDRLFAIAMMSAVASHFVEIQTGIQIASTWTYFYLIAGMMVAFGYYITGYLRPAEEAALDGAGSITTDGAAAPGARGTSEAVMAETKPVAAAVGAGSRGGSAQATIAANGKPSIPSSNGYGQRNRTKASQAVQQPPQRSGTTGSRGASGGGRQPSMRTSVQRRDLTTRWYRSPVLLALYGLAALVALFIVWTVNSASVRADTLFKQAQAYDNATRYFDQQDAKGVRYPGSLSFYNEAIDLQPNQDYYYLFLGRAWLETAKQVDSETCPSQDGNQQTPCNIRTQGIPYSTDPTKATQEKQAERLVRLRESEAILKEANALSPMNTDHYANLGRLYLYWGDTSASGGQDPSKTPLAVQWMQQATAHTPGNAQLWDELAVAYTRNNQFKEGIDALNHSQYDLDPTYARTPFIKGQILQERASNTKSDLTSGTPLPTDGENDYGKLVLDAGKAYSDTVGTDPGQFMDDQASSRMDFLLQASQPFTNSNTQVPAETLRNVLTDTVQLAFKNQIANWEGQLSGLMKDKGVTAEAGANVPDSALQPLLSNRAWFDPAAQAWLNDSMKIITDHGSVAHYGMGLSYQAQNMSEQARAEYNRALLLKPGYQEPQKALEDEMKNWEAQISVVLKARGVAVPADQTVPDSTIQTLLKDSAWANQTTLAWLDSNMRNATDNAAIYHYGLGISFERTGQADQARNEYNRALLLRPGYAEAQKALQGIR